MSSLIERGGPVMWPLLLLSIVAVAIVFERTVFWYRERRREAFGSPAAPGAAQMERERRRLEQGMVVLETIITAAPLLGILGTVLGIIESLDVLSADAAPNPVAVSGGVAEALITTATGLSISLATLFPYNGFSSRVRDRLGELEQGPVDHAMARELG